MATARAHQVHTPVSAELPQFPETRKLPVIGVRGSNPTHMVVSRFVERLSIASARRFAGSLLLGLTLASTCALAPGQEDTAPVLPTQDTEADACTHWRADIMEARGSLSGLLARYTEQHPDVILARERLEHLESLERKSSGLCAEPALSPSTIDHHGRIHVDGAPFFPIGLYSVPLTALDHARRLGFNTVHTYDGEGLKEHNDAVSAAAMRTYLRTAASLGLRVLLGLPRYQVAQQHSVELARRVSALRKEPAILAWYLFDEPDCQGVELAAVENAARLVRTMDPDTPTAIASCGHHERYVRFSDVAIPVEYPLRRSGDKLSSVWAEVSRTRSAQRAHAQTWAAIQLHGKGPGGRGYGLLEPRYDEVRNMAYQAIAAGANGLMFFAYDGRQFNLFETPAGLDNAARLAAELRRISPILLAEHARLVPPAAVVSPNSSIRLRWFEANGVAHLLAVNVARDATSLKLQFGAQNLPIEVRDVLGGAVVGMERTSMVQMLEPLAIRLYAVRM